MHAPPAYFRRARTCQRPKAKANRVGAASGGGRRPAVRPQPQPPRTPASGDWSRVKSQPNAQSPREWNGMPAPCSSRCCGVSRARAAVGDERESSGRAGTRRDEERRRRKQVTERQVRRRTCRDAHVRRSERAPRHATHPAGADGRRRRSSRVEWSAATV